MVPLMKLHTYKNHSAQDYDKWGLTMWTSQRVKSAWFQEDTVKGLVTCNRQVGIWINPCKSRSTFSRMFGGTGVTM